MTVLSSPVPVGRSKELGELLAPVARDRPAVLVVAGRPGSGRSYLISQVRDEAVRLGFRCIGVDEDLVVDKATTLQDVWRVLRTFEGSETTGNGAPSRGVPAGLRVKVGLAFERHVDTARYNERALDSFRRAAPLMLAVEGYTPSPTLGTWVVARLVPFLRKNAVPIVLVFSGVEQNLKGVSGVADAVVTLGDLDRDEVRAYLRKQADGVHPAVDEDELSAYVDAAARQPTLLDAFTRVLDALRRGDAHEPY